MGQYKLGLINTDNLVILKFRILDNFTNNSNPGRFLNSYALKLYEARRLKNHLKKFLYSLETSKKRR